MEEFAGAAVVAEERMRGDSDSGAARLINLEHADGLSNVPLVHFGLPQRRWSSHSRATPTAPYRSTPLRAPSAFAPPTRRRNPNSATLRNVEFLAVADGGDVAEIVVHVDDNGVEIGYGFLAAIVSQISTRIVRLRGCSHRRRTFSRPDPHALTAPARARDRPPGQLLFLEYCMTAVGRPGRG